eukprot:TRINITY_DN15030_c0_g1_i1.p1 TRINITY_DN15030_c0_g1~~TRINITY_DN15030_c0_g1_i1.p1  ORF type:complete len:300 (+),score=34.88 TRINITY_DN15030_c0_g1_i1:105-1004(+)
MTTACSGGGGSENCAAQPKINVARWRKSNVGRWRKKDLAVESVPQDLTSTDGSSCHSDQGTFSQTEPSDFVPSRRDSLGAHTEQSSDLQELSEVPGEIPEQASGNTREQPPTLLSLLTAPELPAKCALLDPPASLLAPSVSSSVWSNNSSMYAVPVDGGLIPSDLVEHMDQLIDDPFPRRHVNNAWQTAHTPEGKLEAVPARRAPCPVLSTMPAASGSGCGPAPGLQILGPPPGDLRPRGLAQGAPPRASPVPQAPPRASPVLSTTPVEAQALSANYRTSHDRVGMIPNDFSAVAGRFR